MWAIPRNHQRPSTGVHGPLTASSEGFQRTLVSPWHGRGQEFNSPKLHSFECGTAPVVPHSPFLGTQVSHLHSMAHPRCSGRVISPTCSDGTRNRTFHPSARPLRTPSRSQVVDTPFAPCGCRNGPGHPQSVQVEHRPPTAVTQHCGAAHRSDVA